MNGPGDRLTYGLLPLAARLLLMALALAGCRASIPRSDHPARVTLAYAATLAREGSAEFTVDGALEGEGAVALDAGSIAVLDYDLARIVVIDTAGRTVRSFGRRGGGPGEIENPRFLVRTRAGLGVVDDQKFALVQFTLAGRGAPELPLNTLIGIPTGILTGLAELGDGSWVFTVTEKRELTWRQALYQRSPQGLHEIASTPVATARPVRLPCGLTLSPEPPVFWPTLRWSARPGEVAFAATGEDRVTRWDPVSDDSTVMSSSAAPRRASPDAALATLPLTRVQLGRSGCALTREEALRQRGMMKTLPAIERVVLSPLGALWVRSQGEGGGSITRIFRRGSVDTLYAGPFPDLFLTEDRFVTANRDSTGNSSIELWNVQRNP